MKDNNTIPLIVDDIKNYENIQFTRCIYLTIESDVPLPNWRLHYKNEILPFFMLGLKGIIYRPLTPLGSVERDIFRSSKDFEELYTGIEADEDFYIGMDEIWIPNSIFRNTQRRGELYRIDSGLFHDCYKYTQGLITYNQLTEITERKEDRITISETETYAFSAWRKSVIGEVRTSEENETDEG